MSALPENPAITDAQARTLEALRHSLPGAIVTMLPPDRLQPLEPGILEMTSINEDFIVGDINLYQDGTFDLPYDPEDTILRHLQLSDRVVLDPYDPYGYELASGRAK